MPVLARPVDGVAFTFPSHCTDSSRKEDLTSLTARHVQYSAPSHLYVHLHTYTPTRTAILPVIPCPDMAYHD